MRGSPIFRALLALLVLLLMGVPVWRLTRHEHGDAPPTGVDSPGKNPATSPDAGKSAAKKLVFVFDFTQKPKTLQVTYLGETIWSEIPVAGREYKIAVPVAAERQGAPVELGFRVEWPGEGQCALRVRATDESGRETDRSIWGSGGSGAIAGSGPVEDVLTFP